MTEAPPQLFDWDGDTMKPVRPKLADQHYVVHQRYMLVEYEPRSMKSHNHYFAAVHDAWANLPEHLAERFPTPESLRKYALIKAGYSDSTSIVCASKAEAQRVAAFVRPADEFSIVIVSEATVTRYVAKSQSMRAMGRQIFQQSKNDVLDVAAAMVNVTPRQIEQNVRQVA